MKKFKGFKNETTPPFRATIQAFTTYTLKTPDVKLGNDNLKQSLLMEILSELNKCPKELFNHLTDKDKKIFDPKVEGVEKENVVLNSTNYEDINDEDLEEAIKELTALKRHEDRFPYFALRFLDEIHTLEDIRFQITLGKLVTDKYDKTIIGNKQDRRIIKTINAFGKLSDFENKEHEILTILKKELDNEDIKFEQFSPHYNMNNNKIAFYIFDKNENKEKIKYPNVFENKSTDTSLQNNPTGFISIHNLTKLLLLLNIQEPNKNTTEDIIKQFVLKSNQILFDKTFIDDIKSKTNYEPITFSKRVFDKKKLQEKNVEVCTASKAEIDKILKNHKLTLDQLKLYTKDDFLKRTKNKKEIEIFSQFKYRFYLDKRRDELQKKLPAGVLVNQLPEKLKEYLMDIREVNPDKKIHLAIKQIKEDTKKLLKISKKEPSENEKPKLGEYATYITRDILNMIVDKDLKNKITQPYFNKLQNKIAFFSINKSDIIAILNELELFNPTKGHVFLKESLINESNGVIDFYKNYLESKIKWIDEKLLKLGKTGGYILNNKTIPYTFEKFKNKTVGFNFENWLINKSSLPVNLPNSLFDETLNNTLKGKLKRGKISFTDNDKFALLLRKFLNKDSQPFYNFDRKYNEIVIKQAIGLSSKTIKTKYDGFIEANEKLIRFTQTKDRILKLMCDAILNNDKSVGLQEEIELKNIFPNSKKSILEHQATFIQQFYKKERNEFYVIAKDSEAQIQEIKRWEAIPELQKQNWLKQDTKEKQIDFLKTIPETEKQIYLGQKGYQWTFKDFGRFKRFIKDKRIPELSEYFEEKSIPFDFLEFQIKEYDRIREKIFNLIFKLEKTIVEKDFEGIKNLELNEFRQKKHPVFNEIDFKVYYKWLENAEITNIKFIYQCRNKFSHSQFPSFSDIENLESTFDNNETFKQITKQETDNFEFYKHKKDYKDTVNISIAQNIFNKFEKDVNRIIAQL